MPKKKRTSKNRASSAKISYSKISAVILLLLVVGIMGKAMVGSESYHVLGTSTLLAKGGSDDSGGNSGSGSSGSGSSGSSDSNNDDSGSSGSSGGSSRSGSSGGSGSNNSENSGSSNNGTIQSSNGVSTSNTTKVICTGPDGKQFETRAKDCEELNKAWNKPANFTILPTQAKTTKIETRARSISPSLAPSISDTPELENEDSGIRTKTETKQDEERTEIRLSEGERIRTRTKDGQTRIDITSGGIKTRFEIKNGRVIIKAEQEDGTEVELADDTLLKIDDRLAADNIKVATAGAERFLVQKGVAGAVTDFPISVDLATNTVFVTTPTGQKTITVLPEQAIQNLIAANIVNRLGGRAIVNETLNNNLTSVSQLISLGEKNGIPVYEINGISDQKLLGFISVQVEKDLTVSAETGNVLSSSIPFGSRVLDLLSF